MIRGDDAEASRLGEETRQRSAEHEHGSNLSTAHFLLSSAARARGQYETAQYHARRACSISQEIGDRWFLAYCLHERGQVEQALGNYAAAAADFQAGYALREEFDDPEGMAVALTHLGQIAAQQDDHIEARRFFRRSQAIYQDTNDRGGLATALTGLAMVECALGNYASARQYFQLALQIALDIQFVQLLFSLLIGIGELLLRTKHEERGISLLSLVYDHADSEHATKERAEHIISRYGAQVSANVGATATQHYRHDDLQTIANNLLVELAGLEEPSTAASPPVEQTPSVSQDLVEPLTECEREVLHFLKDGLVTCVEFTPFPV